MGSVAQRRFFIWISLLGAFITGCTLNSDSTPVVITGTPPPVTSPEVVAEAGTLETFTGPYPDMVTLLDGVCFEYLYTMNGRSWVWQSLGELYAFYDQVDASGLCPGLIRRGTFDFSEQVLVGVVHVATGCDAAHRFIDLTQEDQGQTLLLQFEFQPDCGYELAQPFLIAVPRPPEGNNIRVVIVTR